MKTILFVPLRDYFQSRKQIAIRFLVPLGVGIIALIGAFILNIGTAETIKATFADFIAVQINIVAILVSFSVAIISILVTADSKNIKKLRETPSDANNYKPINQQQPSLFQVLLSNIAYNVVVEILYLMLLIGISLLSVIIPVILLKYITAICIAVIVHILSVLLESVAQMYLTFWSPQE